MAKETPEQQKIEEQVLTILRALSPERAQEVLDFAAFLRARAEYARPADNPQHLKDFSGVFQTYTPERFTTTVVRPPSGDEKWDAIFSNEYQAEIDDWATKLLNEDEPTTGIITDGNELRPAP